MSWGLIAPILMTIIIIFGPLIRALEDKDYYEIFIDIFLIVMFWLGYYLLAFASSFELVDRIINKLNY